MSRRKYKFNNGKIKISTYNNYEIIAVSDKKIEGIDTYKNLKIAVEKANGKYFMIVDENLIKIDKDSYIEDLVGICQDENVGIVGTKLYNEKNTVEHCGIILGMNGAGDFLYKGAPKDIGTYMQRLLIIHNVECVYIKYAMIDKEIFEQIGGFTEEFSGLLKSIDICAKIITKGKQVVINPIISICVKQLDDIEKEKNQEIKLKEKWKELYKKGDIYFSPNLSKTDTGLSINI